MSFQARILPFFCVNAFGEGLLLSGLSVRRYAATLSLIIALASAAFPGRAEDLPILAQLIPVQDTILSTEMDGRLLAFSGEEGARVGSGDIVASINCDREEARLFAAGAAVNAAEIKLASLRKLVKLRSATEMEMRLAGAEYERARGEETVLKAMVNACVIRAPFPGIVAVHHVKAHQYLRTGQEVATIFDDSKLRASFLAPSDWLTTRKPGDMLAIRVIETGESREARILRLGSMVDAISRSVEVEAELEGDISGLSPGMSAEILTPGL